MLVLICHKSWCELLVHILKLNNPAKVLHKKSMDMINVSTDICWFNLPQYVSRWWYPSTLRFFSTFLYCFCHILLTSASDGTYLLVCIMFSNSFSRPLLYVILAAKSGSKWSQNTDKCKRKVSFVRCYCYWCWQCYIPRLTCDHGWELSFVRGNHHTSSHAILRHNISNKPNPYKLWHRDLELCCCCCYNGSREGGRGDAYKR